MFKLPKYYKNKFIRHYSTALRLIIISFSSWCNILNLGIYSKRVHMDMGITYDTNIRKKFSISHTTF